MWSFKQGVVCLFYMTRQLCYDVNYNTLFKHPDAATHMHTIPCILKIMTRDKGQGKLQSNTMAWKFKVEPDQLSCIK